MSGLQSSLRILTLVLVAVTVAVEASSNLLPRAFLPIGNLYGNKFNCTVLRLY